MLFDQYFYSIYSNLGKFEMIEYLIITLTIGILYKQLFTYNECR